MDGDFTPSLPASGAARRRWLAQAGWASGLSTAAAQATPATPASPSPSGLPVVSPQRVLRFPQDFGAHPQARTEWWYLTGWLAAADAAAGARPAWGFQLTFFRSRTDLAADSRSAFAPRQLILLHGALTDVARQRLWHTQQVARAALGVAAADEGDTRVHLRHASLQRDDDHGVSLYRGRFSTPDFSLQLQARRTQPVMLQGQAGWSRKGPQPTEASHYYSEPQLAVAAQLQPPSGGLQRLQGRAWLDHEWSESVLSPDATGWDWIGMNLDDGSALMAFRIRDRQGRTLWAGGGWREAGGTAQALSPTQLRWTPGETWRSPRTGARYPVRWTLEVAGRRYRIEALVPDQEQDARDSTGTAYWEGLSALNDEQGRRVGWGYLEMTGYAGSLKL